MIKRIFLLLLFVGVFCITSCFGYTLIDNCYMTSDTSCTSYTRQMPCRELENNEEFTYDGDTYKIDNNANFYTYTGGQYVKTLYKYQNISNYSYYQYFYRGEDNLLHKTLTRSSYGNSITFNSGGVCIYNTNNIQELADVCGIRTKAKGTDQSERCVGRENAINNKFNNDINEFYNTNGGFDKIYFLPGKDVNNNLIQRFGRLCFIKGNTGYCLFTDFRDNVGTYENNSLLGTVITNDSNYKTSNFNITNNIDVFKSSPFSGQSGGGNNSDDDIYITASCSKQNALNWYENNGYSDKLCFGGYTGYTIWDGSPTGVLPLFGSGEIIDDIRMETAHYYQGGVTGDTMSYSAWFGYRRQLYSTYKRGGYSINPFINTPLVLFGLFSAVDIYGSNFNSKDILEYCDLKYYTANYDVAYTGVNYNNVCKSAISFLDDYLDNVNQSGGIGVDTNKILNGTGGCLGSGCSDGSGKNYTNGSNFITDFSDMLKANLGDIANNNYGQGILPIYITLALLGLILFRFISH